MSEQAQLSELRDYVRSIDPKLFGVQKIAK